MVLPGFFRKKTKVHFLHIGKTGGTAVKHALQEASPRRFQLVLHEHAFRLQDVPVGEQAFFFLRHPLDRFVSGFNSRWRQGMPRYRSEWNPDERTAFLHFTTPNALAEGLCSQDHQVKQRAEDAMAQIRHVNALFGYWLGTPSYFQTRASDIFFVGFQETLTADLATVSKRLGLGAEVQLPSTDLLAHRSPADLPRHLSPLAISALKTWYAEDIRTYETFKRAHPSGSSPHTDRST